MGCSSRLQRQACQQYTEMSATTASATHHQFMVAKSSRSAPSLTSRSDQIRQPIEMMFVTTSTTREHKLSPHSLSQSNAEDLYWTPAQLIAHHTRNGCNLQIGDVLATGTISGPSEASAGCLLELTRNGARPILLPTGESRTFLEDGDEIILRGFCETVGHPRIGLGECRATILPALT